METVIKTQPSYVHDPKWATAVSRLVKAQMAATGITYADLSRKLKEIGTLQSPENLRVKINRGNFGAQLFLQIFLVMGRKELNLRDLENIAYSSENNSINPKLLNKNN